MTPMPPCCASAIARAASVTVSIAEEHNGIWSWMLRVNCVDVSVSFGKTSERAGTRSTSSNVRPSGSSTEIIWRYRLLKINYEMKIINRNTTARHSERAVAKYYCSYDVIVRFLWVAHTLMYRARQHKPYRPTTIAGTVRN